MPRGGKRAGAGRPLGSLGSKGLIQREVREMSRSKLGFAFVERLCHIAETATTDAVRLEAVKEGIRLFVPKAKASERPSSFEPAMQGEQGPQLVLIPAQSDLPLSVPEVDEESG